MISKHIDLLKEKNIVKESTVVMLGIFDGVHTAHTHLIKEGVKRSGEENLVSVVFTFGVNLKKGGSITDNSLKEKYISQTGADILVYQEVSSEFLSLAPEDFFKLLVQNLKVKIIYVGENYTFGKEKTGNTEVLKKLGEKYGVEVNMLNLDKRGGEVISSSLIKKYLGEGNVKKANLFLGRNYEIEGIIQHGNHIGNTIGFPTVNIYPKKNMFLPKYGVYRTKVITKYGTFKGVTNIGVKPTVSKPRLSVETYIIGLDKNMYGEKITLEILDFIRPETKFSNLEQLKLQIEKDKKEAENEN